MNQALLIALSVPVLTIVIPKILDMLQKRHELQQQYKQSVQKAVFDKKIKIAEDAAYQLTQLKLLIHMVRDLIDMSVNAFTGKILPKKKVLPDKDVLLNIVNAIQYLYEQIKPNDIFSLTLYFDVTGKDSDYSNQAFLSSISNIRSLMTSLRTNVKSLNVILREEIDNQDALLHNINDVINDLVLFVKSMKEFLRILKSIEGDIDETISRIKSEMNQFQGFKA